MTKATVFISWDNAPHITEAQKETILAGIPPWQRDSRTKGVPQLGAGAIYAVPETDITCSPFALPRHWPRCFGMDVGWQRTAVAWFALDRDTSTVYLYDEYYRAQAEPSVHAAAIAKRGLWIPGAIDPASHGRSQKDGEALFDIYKSLGLDIDNAINAREAGIAATWERFSTGTLKVFKTCQNTLSEYRLYRRNEKGDIVKANDHLMDALRYGIMSGLDRAKIEPAHAKAGQEWWTCAPASVWSG